jgi:hypothetical protein
VLPSFTVKKIALVVVVAGILFNGTTAIASRRPVLTGFGVYFAAWNRAHVRDPNYGGQLAYGPYVARLPSFTQPEYIMMQTAFGLRGYIKTFPATAYGLSLDLAGLSVPLARARVLAEMPPGTKVTKFFVHHSSATQACAFLEMRLPYAVGFDGDAVATATAEFTSIGVTYSSVNGVQVPVETYTWQPNHVNTFHIAGGVPDPPPGGVRNWWAKGVYCTSEGL